MAAISNIFVNGLLFVCLVFSSNVRVVSSYRLFPYAFQSRQLPRSTHVSTWEGSTSWRRHVPTADAGATQNQPEAIRYLGTMQLVHSQISETSSKKYAMIKLETKVTEHAGMSRGWLLVCIITPVVLFVVCISLFFLWTCRCRVKSSSKSNMLIWTNQSTLQQSVEAELSSDSSRSKGIGPWLSHIHNLNGNMKADSLPTTPCSIAYSVLQAATSNFSSSNLLGEGSSGHVYKARLDYGVLAAVKRLTNGGKQRQASVQVGMDLMGKVRHPNLVALLGYSNDGPEPLLVYELMQNGSLHDQLHGPSHGSALTWHLRLKIALEAARGLEHLHESCKPPIIHKDMKASNILLDASFNAKVCDFGQAISMGEGSPLKDFVQVQDTLGYIAPEFLTYGTLTEKSDVYSFGVVLLELLTGKLPIDVSMPLDSQSLVTWAIPLLTDRGKALDIMDPCLQDTVNVKHLHQIAAVAALCVQSEASYRPLITDVVQSLVPLVPQQFGGALRDPNKCFVSFSNGKEYLGSANDLFVPDLDLDSPSMTSDSSLCSQEEPLSRNSQLVVELCKKLNLEGL